MQPHWLVKGIVCVAMVFAARGAPAQEVDRRSFELGVQFSRFHLEWSALDSVEPGIGGWVGYALNDYLAIDGQLDLFPRKGGLGGRHFQTMAGIKSGVRGQRVGVFGKVRPGLVRFSQEFGRPCAPTTLCTLIYVPVDQINFMLDLGGVLEVYPTARTVVRTDVGDTVIRFGWRDSFRPSDAGASSHNFRISVGAGLKF